MIKTIHLLLYILLFVQFSLFAQSALKIEPDHVYTIQPQRYLKPLKKDSLEIDKIVNLPFDSINFSELAIGKEYWGRFQFRVDNPHRIITLSILFEQSDNIVLYVPVKSGGFRSYKTGFFFFQEPLAEFYEGSQVIIDGIEVNFTKPFYFKNTPMTSLGTSTINKGIKIEAHSNIPLYYEDAYKSVERSSETYEFTYAMLLGMMIISFVFMILHFFIIKKIYFLYYSIYMFLLIFNYGYRTFYFYNVYAEIKPILYFYFNQNGQLLAMLAYMLFFRSFIDMKNNYKKLYTLFNYTLYAYIGCIILYYGVVSIFPHTYQHIIVMNTIMILFTITNLISAFYALIKKGTLETRFIIIGGLFLGIGYLVAEEFNFFIFIPIVVLETAILVSVLSYQNLKKNNAIHEAEKQREMDKLKSEFYANITHEFRTPLTLITVPILEKLKSPGLSQKERTDFEMIQRNNDRLLQLVNQLLNISKVESGNRKLFLQKDNPLDFVSSVVQSFVYQTNRKFIKYTVNIETNRGEVWYDKDIVEKVVTNLLSNAYKYTPKNGAVICNAAIQNKKIYIEVKNTGKGIPKEASKKIFDRFYQVDDSLSGSGIGLALVKELVELHNGIITVDSTPNEWTTFKVQLPGEISMLNNYEIIHTSDQIHLQTSIPEASTEDIAVEIVNKTDPKKTLPILLIVEDNIDLLKLLRDNFEKEFKILTAMDGQKGIEIALKNIPDLIISDVMMPVKDGIALTRKLKNDIRTSHIPIMLLTAKFGEEHEFVGIKAGADDYVTKPYSSRILKSKVENIIKLREKLRDRYIKQHVLIAKEITTNTLDEKFLIKAENILNQRFKDPSFTTKKFSDEMAMTRMTLHRKLTAITGMSTTKFINSKRLKLATHLLSTSDMNISEIVYEVGFENISYFNKCFRKMYRCTPTEYRKLSFQSS